MQVHVEFLIMHFVYDAEAQASRGDQRVDTTRSGYDHGLLGALPKLQHGALRR